MEYNNPKQVKQEGGSRLEIVKISQVDYQKGLVKLLVENKDNTVTNWIPYSSFEYEMPKVGDTVLYVPENTNYQNPYSFGLCLGRYYNKGEVPKLSGKEIYYKAMLGDVVIIYNSDEKKLTIQTEKEIEVKAVEKISIKAKGVTIEAKEIKCSAETINLTASNIILSGTTSIQGETFIDGNLTVSGIVSAANI